MSYLLEKARKQVEEIKKELNSGTLAEPVSKLYTERLAILEARVQKYEKLEKNGNFEKITAEMKIIRNHVKAVDDKYNCKTVKFSYSVADFFDKISLTKPLAKRIREYIVNKINAPVCSILGNDKPEMEPMPTYGSDDSDNMKMKKDLKKWANLSTYAFEQIEEIEQIEDKSFKSKVKSKLRKILA